MKWSDRYLPAQINHRRRFKMSLLAGLVMFVFTIMFFTTLFVGSMFIFLYRIGFIPIAGATPFHYIVMILLIFSIAISTALTAIFGSRPLRPFHKMIEATRKIAIGNFNVQVPVRGPEELRNLAQSFNTMANELKSIETMRSDFVSNVSHEFRTPVSTINGFAKLLKKNTLPDEKRKEYLDIIIKESERLSKLSGNVLLLSKLENLNRVEEKTVYYLDEQLRQAVLILQPEWQRKKISFQINLPSIRFTGNEELIQQIWLNLIGNAIKFSKENGKINIQLTETKTQSGHPAVLVIIIDKGIGMSDEVVKRLFDKFYQGDSSHAVEGNGLGLSLVKRIVELSNGSIHVTSSPGSGSTFYIELPNTSFE